MVDRIKDFTSKNEVDLLVIGKDDTAANKESLNELMEKIHVPLVVVPC